MTTPHDHTQDPLHGITLERMLVELVDHFGWEAMGEQIQGLTSHRTSSPACRWGQMRGSCWSGERRRLWGDIRR